jgi:hypothetical protein
LTLHRSIGDEEFIVTRATMGVIPQKDGVRLYFDVQTEGKRARPASDALRPANQVDDARPNAEVSVTLPVFAPEKFVGQRFEVAGYDEVADEPEAIFFYLEHDLLINNVIEILDRAGNTFQVRWTGLHLAFLAEDASDAGPPVEIVAWFTFVDLEKWLPASR